MLITQRKFGFINILNIYFSDEPLINTLPDCDVVTYHSYKNWGTIEGYEKHKCLTTTIDLSQDIDIIWKKINRQHKRHIRRAEKNGTKVTINNNYEKFHQIYKRFLKQKNYADPTGINVLSSQFIQKYGILFIAENQGEIMGGNFYFHDKHNAILGYSAYPINENNFEYKKRRADANCYLYWKAILYFKNMNINNFDLGDVLCDDININHQMSGGEYFKRSFGGDVISRYRYIKFNSRLIKSLFSFWNSFQHHRLFPPE